MNAVHSDQHVDATGYWIAVALVDDDGRDPAWVTMVMEAKGHGNIDIGQARDWLAAHPKAQCCCRACRPEPASVQLTLI